MRFYELVEVKNMPTIKKHFAWEGKENTTLSKRKYENLAIISKRERTMKECFKMPSTYFTAKILLKRNYKWQEMDRKKKIIVYGSSI